MQAKLGQDNLINRAYYRAEDGMTNRSINQHSWA